MEDKVITDEKQALKDIDLKGVTQVQISDELSNNPNFMLQAMDIDRYVIELASDELKNDSQFMQECLKIDVDLFKFVGEELLNDTEFLKVAISNNNLIVPLIDDSFYENKEFMTELVENGTTVIPYVSDELKNDIEFALKSIEQNPNAFNFVSDELKAENGNTLEDFLSNTKDNSIDIEQPDVRTVGETNYSIIESEMVGEMEIVLGENTNGHFATWTRNVEVDNDKGGENFNHGNYFMADKESAIENFQERINNEKDLDIDLDNDIITKEQALEMVEENGLELKNLPDFQDDKDVVMTAFENDCTSLEFAIDELKNDSDFMVDVINFDILGLEYASDDLLNDPDFMQQAIDIDDNSYFHASDDLRADPDFIMYAIDKGYPIEDIDDEFIFNNESFMKDLIDLDYENVQFMGDELKVNPDFILEVMQDTSDIDGVGILEYVDPKLVSDKDFMLQATSIDGFAINYIDSELYGDKDLVINAFENGFLVENAIDELVENKDFVLNAVDCDFHAFDYASLELRNDKDVVMQAIDISVFSLQYADDELRNDKDFMLEVVEKHGVSILEDVNTELLNNPEFMKQINDIATKTPNEVVQDSPYQDLAERIGNLAEEKNEIKPIKSDVDLPENYYQDLALEQLESGDLEPLQTFLNETIEEFDSEISEVAQVLLDEVNTIENIQNSLETVEISTEDNLNMIDGILNNTTIEFTEDEIKLDNLNELLKSVDGDNITSEEIRQLADEIIDIDFPIVLINESLRSNEELILILAKEIDINCLENATNKLLNDESFIRSAVEEIGIEVLAYAGDSLINNEYFMEDMLGIDSSAIEFLGDELKFDQEYLLDTLNINPDIIQGIDETILNNVSFLEQVEQNHPIAFDIISMQVTEDFVMQGEIEDYSNSLENLVENTQTKNVGDIEQKQGEKTIDKPKKELILSDVLEEMKTQSKNQGKEDKDKITTRPDNER